MASACHDHLTMILANGGTPKPGKVAGALLSEFGSLPAVLRGSDARLRRIAVDARAFAAIRHFAAAMQHAQTVAISARPVLKNWDALIDYLRFDLSFEPIEYVRVLFLDTRLQLIVDEIVASGTVDTAELHRREVVTRALEVGASSLLLVHNHPSGDPTPSDGDVTLTRWLAEAGRYLGITIEDHIIVGTNGHVSMRARGLM